MKGDYRGLFVGEQQTFGFEFLSFFILYISLSYDLSFFARERERKREFSFYALTTL